MGSINDILSIARTALAANQRAVEVISHNIANAGTEGYSKQRVDFTSRAPFVSAKGVLGTGVDAQRVVRAEDKFITGRLRMESQGLGKWEAMQRSISQVELSFIDNGRNDLAAAITEFFNAAENLSINPESLPGRANLIQRSQTMVTKFNSLANRLRAAQVNIEQEVQSEVSAINRITDNLSTLNKAIIRSESGGNKANDLRDQRDRLILELTSIIDIRVAEKTDGQVLISLDGNILVDGANKRNVALKHVSVGYTSFSSLQMEGVNSDLNITGGKIGGMLDVRDEKIAGYLSRLDSLANTIMSKVNTIHKSGFDLNGNTGIYFFDTTASGAIDMALNSEIANDLTKIAAAAGYDTDSDQIPDTSNGPGDNTTIKALADLRNQSLMSDGLSTFGDYYSNIAGSVGFDAQQAEEMMDTQEALVSQIKNLRDSFVGVSLDEELSQMITFQNTYAAASRLVKAVDEMMRNVLEMV